MKSSSFIKKLVIVLLGLGSFSANASFSIGQLKTAQCERAYLVNTKRGEIDSDFLRKIQAAMHLSTNTSTALQLKTGSIVFLPRINNSFKYLNDAEFRSFVSKPIFERLRLIHVTNNRLERQIKESYASSTKEIESLPAYKELLTHQKMAIEGLKIRFELVFDKSNASCDLSSNAVFLNSYMLTAD